MGHDLAQRAEQARGQQVAKQELTLAQQIERMQVEYQRAMPKGAEAVQLVRDAMTCLRTINKLDQCEAPSVLGALMTCAQLGLRPGVLGQAWPVPFWDKKAGPKDPRTDEPKGAFRAQLVIGYQGLVELAHRSGRVASLIARTVHAGDVFEVDYGLSDNLIHKPNLNSNRGEPIAYYAIVKFINGGHAFYVMSQPEMLAYRDQHASTKGKYGVYGPWKDHFEAMAHKTCVRQLAKWMPKSAELASAIAADEGVRVNLNPEADPESSTAYVPGEVVSEEPEPFLPPDDGGPDAAKPSEGGQS